LLALVHQICRYRYKLYKMKLRREVLTIISNGTRFNFQISTASSFATFLTTL